MNKHRLVYLAKGLHSGWQSHRAGQRRQPTRGLIWNFGLFPELSSHADWLPHSLNQWLRRPDSSPVAGFRIYRNCENPFISGQISWSIYSTNGCCCVSLRTQYKPGVVKQPETKQAGFWVWIMLDLSSAVRYQWKSRKRLAEKLPTPFSSSALSAILFQGLA